MSDTTTPPQFTSALGDPFDPAGVSNLHQPGMLGVSPDVWRSLANFGANMATAANARTPGGFLANGTGFAGPFAAAVGQSNQQGLGRGEVLSNMALNRAHAQNLQMQNYVTAMNLPLQIAQNRMILEMMQDPQAWAAKYGFGNPALSAGTSASNNGGSTDNWKPAFGGAQNAPQVPKEYIPFYEEASKRTGIPVSVLEAQSAQESGYNPGATGAAGEIGITQIKPDTARNPGYGLTGVQNPDVLRDPRTNILFGADYLKARAGGNVDWTDPAQVAAALRSYNGGGDAQYAQHVMRYIPASQPQTAAAPAAPAPYQTASNTPVAPPSQAAPSSGGYANYPENNPAATGGQPTPVGNLGLVRNPDGSVGTPGGGFGGKPTPQPQPQPQPQTQQPQPQQPNAQALRAQQFMRAADQAEAQADQLARQQSQINVENARRAAFIKSLPAPMQMAASMNPNLQPLPMPPGDAVALRANAQEYRKAALSLQQPIATREGIYDPTTGQTIYRSPQLVDTIDPNTGRVSKVWTQFNEGGNQPLPSKLGPGEEEALEGPSKEFNSEPAIKSYNSSIQTLGWTETMQQDFDSLNKSGDPWSKTGPGADIRMHAAATINDAMRSVGLPEVFNPSKIADWESLQKQTRVAGMQLTSSLFGAQREAATIVNSAIASVPGDNQSPQGAQKILNIIRDSAQYQVDRRNYIQAQARQNGGDFAKPALEFDNGGKTIKSYMIRAMSQSAPIQLTAKNPQEFYSNGESKRYLPGTLVRSASGTVFPVPDPNQQQAQGGNG